ncbi:uncharacterized protein LOC120131261 [Hibiscus syriacus]|uniref:uncharacterized protein LOC120131261 n=1 Tax=Hibiscus syriacus TaxID=106335 RepID=UPI0019215232|nr:uncharacterized protein LOC120131261 [Hibiscus syriacus]
MVHANDPSGGYPPKKAQDRERKAFGEIEEEESEETTCLDEGITAANQLSNNKFADSNGVNAKQKTEGAVKKFAENLEMTLDDSKNSNDINDTRSARLNSLSKEVNHNKVVPTSPQQNVIPAETNQVGLNHHENGTNKTNRLHEKGVNDVEKLSKWRKHRFCCFGLYSG